MEAEAAATYRITDVRVEAAPASAREPRGFNLAEGEVETIVRSSALSVVNGLNPGGTRAVRVDLTLNSVFVPNVASAALFGGSSTRLGGVAQLRDARTGADIGAPFEVSGASEFRAGGIIGAAATAAVLSRRGENGEIAKAAQGIGRRLALAVFGTDPLKQD